MANNVVITDSGVVVFGSALDNTQTDNFFNFGTDNTIEGEGGNINVTGLATDSATTVVLNSVSGAITGVSDTFTLDGSANSLIDTTPTAASTINFTVLGNGGFNGVDVTNAPGSTVTVKVGVDPTAFAPAGHNTVDIDTLPGGTNNVSLGGADNTVDLIGSTNTVSIGGAGSTVTLDGMATNSVTLGGGGATVTIGFADDNHFGFTSTVTFAGTGNLLNGGDEDYTVSGSTGSSTVHVGDGENSITLGGSSNTVSVWGGDNTIVAGTGPVGNQHVTILGVDGLNTPTPEPDADDAPVPLSPTDYVTISGVGDSVAATYENVNIWGTAIGGATVTLGNGNNTVVLAAAGSIAPGGNHVTVGNGGNGIAVGGGSNVITVGNGANGVTLNDNGNTVTVNDPTGVGNDIVQLEAGTGDTVNLGHAAGSVTGTGPATGLTTVTQSGPNAVAVNLNNGIGHITLGNGTDSVTANGNGTTITAGGGNDIVTANGNGDTISLGGGNNTVTANGVGDTISVGGGNNTVTANGGADKFTFGNGNNSLTANGGDNTGTFGTAGAGGNNTLVATGSGDVWTFNENPASTVTATIGSIGMAGDTLNQTGGALDATIWGHGKALNLTDVATVGTTINSDGNAETFDLTNSGGVLNLNPAATGNMLTINGVAKDYSQSLSITNLTTVGTVDLEGLYNPTTGAHIGTFSEFLADLTPTGTGDVLHLQGGGSITFVATTAFKASQFAFS
jgi:hypothetical protein